MARSAVLVILCIIVFLPLAVAQTPVTLEQIMSAPFPSNLVASKTGSRLAWTFDQEGQRNVWVSDGPQFQARQLTKYDADDGQGLSDLRFSRDANTLVYVRGEGKNSAAQSPNPTSNPAGVEQSVWTVTWSGGEPKKIDAGQSPQISARGTVAYLKDNQLWLASLDGSDKPQQIVVRGKNEDPQWSPDGAKLAFVSSRGDHAFIGIYDISAKSVHFLSPSVDTDLSPRWSLSGKYLAFIRRPASPRDQPEGFFIAPDRPDPWAIWLADVSDGAAREIWHSGNTQTDSFPLMAEDTGGGVINWTAGDLLIVAGHQDGWQHLYSLTSDGKNLHLLTPGKCEVEQWSFTPDKQTILFNSNCGPAKEDIDRRQLSSVNIAGGHEPERVTTGSSIEWSPVVLDDNKSFAYFGSDATHPARVFHSTLAPGSSPHLVENAAWPANFPSDRLVVPQQTIFPSADGLELHAQLFLPHNLMPGEKRPAMIFLHGGPMRQMLLGWHYMYYYSNSYSMNQYLASRGYIVMAVNYRSGIGYGHAFYEAPGRAGRGASEYQDVVAAGKYLAGRNDVDAKHIGLWGGSYGGYLTALGLGRNSDLFAAGVDMHGVHDWPTDNWDGKNILPDLTKLAHQSSPVTAVDTWRSPVLFIHADDDRNVIFTQTVDLVARLRAKGVEIDQLIFPDDIHDFLLHRNWVAAYHATSDFFDHHFGGPWK
ncbi:MAG: prolyl oligopeptidase family serine peptidase [Acidobacteriota bacterium]|nr:prolyl oligopeptidase family serine peptidase [Acidobacteriota bacterium]